MVGLTPPPHDWAGNDGQLIYFDSIDNSAYILEKAPHSARNSWIYIDGETFQGARADIGSDPKEPWAAARDEDRAFTNMWYPIILCANYF